MSDKDKFSFLDEIPAIILKNYFPELFRMLTSLFQMFHDTETFPNGWKTVQTQLIPKEGLNLFSVIINEFQYSLCSINYSKNFSTARPFSTWKNWEIVITSNMVFDKEDAQKRFHTVNLSSYITHGT